MGLDPGCPSPRTQRQALEAAQAPQRIVFLQIQQRHLYLQRERLSDIEMGCTHERGSVTTQRAVFDGWTINQPHSPSGDFSGTLDDRNDLRLAHLQVGRTIGTLSEHQRISQKRKAHVYVV